MPNVLCAESPIGTAGGFAFAEEYHNVVLSNLTRIFVYVNRKMRL
jgi:hypothetical protein